MDEGRPYVDDDDGEGDRQRRRVQQCVRLSPCDRTSGWWRSTIYAQYCGERDVEQRGQDQHNKESGGSGGDRDVDDKDWDRDRDGDLDCDAEDIDDIEGGDGDDGRPHDDNDRPFASYDNNDDGDGYDVAYDVNGGSGWQRTVSLPPLDTLLSV